MHEGHLKQASCEQLGSAMSRRRHYPFFANEGCKGSDRDIEILESCSSSQVFPVLF